MLKISYWLWGIPSLCLIVAICAVTSGELYKAQAQTLDQLHHQSTNGFTTQEPTIKEFDGLTSNSAPAEITRGPDGAFWFTEFFGNKIGRITPDGKAEEFAISLTPPSNLPQQPAGITLGPDGNLWFTESGSSQIGRINPGTKDIDQFNLPTTGAMPSGITVGPDGNLWFTEVGSGVDKIGRITPDGRHIKEFQLPSGSLSVPGFFDGITSGPDGMLAFTERGSGKIGFISTRGDITEISIPTTSSGPADITVGPDGMLWFTEFNSSKIGHIVRKDGQFSVQEFPVVTSGSGPGGISKFDDKRLVFTEFGSLPSISPSVRSGIGIIDLSGQVSEFPIPTTVTNSHPFGITKGEDGTAWFTDFGASMIGRFGLS